MSRSDSRRLWHRHLLVPIVAIAMTTGMAVAAPSTAEASPVPPPGVPKLPSWTLVPRTTKSVPLGTVVLPGQHPPVTIPLAQYGYVEEEYFISSTANVYNADGSAVVASNVPYTTRILLYRPANPRRFSGTVQMEPLRDQTEATTIVKGAYPYILSHGDIAVGYSVSAANVGAFLKAFDPVRYAPISIPDEGMRYDMMAQVAWLMRSPHGLTAGLGYRVGDIRVYSEGFSLTGAMQVTFIDNRFHARARTPSGGPVIDGYLAGGNTLPLTVPPDAPVIRFNSENEVASGAAEVAIRRPDGNTPADRFRLYEIAGTSHADSADQVQFYPAYVQLGLVPAVSVDCLYPITTLPGHSIFERAALANLDLWVRYSIAPPGGADHYITLNADDSIKKDGFGNTIGGVRPYWLDVPTSTFEIHDVANPADPTRGGECSILGYEVPFSTTALRALYPTHAIYVDKVTAQAAGEVAQGYLLFADLVRIRAEVNRSHIP
jgi:hypothetical protein